MKEALVVRGAATDPAPRGVEGPTVQHGGHLEQVVALTHPEIGFAREHFNSVTLLLTHVLAWSIVRIVMQSCAAVDKRDAAGPPRKHKTTPKEYKEARRGGDTTSSMIAVLDCGP